MEEIIAFLKKIKKNNHKEWFDKHKAHYTEAKEIYEQIVQQIIAANTHFDKALLGLEAKQTTFRIYKDVRFSKDKTPYKTNFGASINPGGKKADVPGYYIHIEPGNSFIGGGCWMPQPDKLQAIRQEIDYNLNLFQKILSNHDFKKYFPGLSKEGKLARPPKGYEKENPAIEFLKHKNFVVIHSIKDEVLLSKNFVSYTAKACQAMYPFVSFLREASASEK